MSDMMNGKEFDQLEQALRTLRPAGGGVNSDRVIYEAGRADGRRSVHRWRAAGAALAIALAASLLIRPAMNPSQIAQREQQQRAVNLPAVLPSPPPEAPPPILPGALESDRPLIASLDVESLRRYHELRRRVLELGPHMLVTLDAPPHAASTHATSSDLSDIERLLEPPTTPRVQPLPWWVRLAAGDPS